MVHAEQLDDLRFLGGVFAEIEQQFNDADYTQLLAQTILDLETAHADYFAEEKSPAGEAWKPLAPLTVAKKGHDTILFEHGPMPDSLIGTTSDSIREVVSEPPNHSLSFGTSDEKSPFHQFGTSRIPIREHVGVNEPFCDQLAEKTADATVALLMPKI